MSLGPVMVDLRGTGLGAAEARVLAHPNVGGVVLFSRNYESPGQLQALVTRIHGLRSPPLLVAVDHEGGRVQRFREGFTRLPPARSLGELHDTEPAAARALARDLGWLMAAELRAVGVDFSFAPVLDLDRGVSSVIGDRAFHRNAGVVAGLAAEVMGGMREAGMEAVGKHFPGHGSVRGDSHEMLPEDGRTVDTIRRLDLTPFRRLVAQGLAAVMPAHVVYTAADPAPAGYSRFWLRQVLRGELGFAGAIVSDDLSMAGAAAAGGLAGRARSALAAGCDLLLACNDPEGAAALVEAMDIPPDPVSQARLVRLHGHGQPLSWERLHDHPRWRRTVDALLRLDPAPQLDLGDGPLV